MGKRIDKSIDRGIDEEIERVDSKEEDRSSNYRKKY